MFWFSGCEACGILALQPGIKPAPPASEDEVLTTGLPGKSPYLLKITFSNNEMEIIKYLNNYTMSMNYKSYYMLHGMYILHVYKIKENYRTMIRLEMSFFFYLS